MLTRAPSYGSNFLAVSKSAVSKGDGAKGSRGLILQEQNVNDRGIPFRKPAYHVGGHRSGIGRGFMNQRPAQNPHVLFVVERSRVGREPDDDFSVKTLREPAVEFRVRGDPHPELSDVEQSVGEKLTIERAGHHDHVGFIGGQCPGGAEADEHRGEEDHPHERLNRYFHPSSSIGRRCSLCAGRHTAESREAVGRPTTRANGRHSLELAIDRTKRAAWHHAGSGDVGRMRRDTVVARWADPWHSDSCWPRLPPRAHRT